MKNQALIKSVSMLGGQAATAAAIRARVPGSKVSQPHVWKWLRREDNQVPPAEYVLPICEAVEFRITPHELRPDLYPHPDDGLRGASAAVRSGNPQFCSSAS